MSLYSIADEPKPSALAQFAVRPFWPFFALCLAGPWAGYGWYLLNAAAIGSPTLRREIAYVIAGFLGVAVIMFAFPFVIAMLGIAPESAAPYIRDILLSWRLLIGYQLLVLQSPPVAILEHYGGKTRDGLIALIALFVADLFLVTPFFSGFGGLVWALIVA